jgi:hypothetical protein
MTRRRSCFLRANSLGNKKNPANGENSAPFSWKINYPENIKFKPEYLSTEYPESIRIAKEAF